MELKIVDFGLASYLRGKQRWKTFCGTPFFIAPEIASRDKKGHSYEVDYWSCGVILYNMIYGQCPFVSEKVDEVYKQIWTGKFKIEPHVDQHANDLIKQLLVLDHNERGSYDEVMQSKFMEGHETLPERMPEKTLL